MKKMTLLALFYDKLAQLVFGNKIKKATTAFFNLINEKDKVLILGGGTGWILEQLHKPTLEVMYVDISEEMIRKAKERKFPFQVEFVTGSYTAIPQAKYDVIITPFFLDMFSDDKAGDVVQHISTFLKENGIWLFSDFIPSQKIHHRILIKMLYLFFSLFYKIEAFGLPYYDHWFSKNHFEILKNINSEDGLMTSRVYIIKN